MAITSMASALEVSKPDNLASFDKATQNVIISGVIQNFEFTYELSHKMLKRYLEATAANPSGIEEMTFQDIIRTGSEQGLLLNGWDVWKDYRTARGTTIHTYDVDKAAEVLEITPDFLREAQYLLSELEKRNY
ncbi:MAG: nucleotidyltransferase substrate binding protein [Nitrospirae bacterium]|nr:nucleotidyltransferase substrate binding protein [Nitrospirota bacterium]